MELDAAFRRVSSFQEDSLTELIAQLEHEAQGLDQVHSADLCERHGISDELVEAAGELKRVSAQINTIVHTVGILRSLPTILSPGERIQALSLGAGSTGRDFDLETDQRIAEFKFIQWKGGSEAIRQNGLFKDFYYLAEKETTKRKYLYVLVTLYPLNFFHGGRTLSSVMRNNKSLQEHYSARYGDRFEKVREYYSLKRNEVNIVDISSELPGLA